MLQQKLKQVQSDLHLAKKELISTYLAHQQHPHLLMMHQQSSMASVMGMAPGPSRQTHELVSREPQQQPMFDPQQIAAFVIAAREHDQEIMRNYEQHQQELNFEIQQWL
ncbi:hypothetical protein HHK36_002522 [Tetracentron sinense]|uniref:Uncharacterized protein n=1 Tax=Tetracentron sinense TaxID=13715 RepID=A0A834ZWL1_TETSI|nr:hypothetical protein HHK36_002522 [Tetracentron sinense]